MRPRKICNHDPSRAYLNPSGGLVCRDCHNEWSRTYRAGRGKEISRAVNLAGVRRLRAKVISVLGNKCVECGNTDYRVMQVDHIHGGGRKEVRSLGNNTHTLYRKVLKDPTPYQLLCANCNWIKRYINKEYGTA